MRQKLEELEAESADAEGAEDNERYEKVEAEWEAVSAYIEELKDDINRLNSELINRSIAKRKADGA